MRFPSWSQVVFTGDREYNVDSRNVDRHGTANITRQAPASVPN